MMVPFSTSIIFHGQGRPSFDNLTVSAMLQVVFTEGERLFDACYLILNEIQEVLGWYCVDGKSLQPLRADLERVCHLLSPVCLGTGALNFCFYFFISYLCGVCVCGVCVACACSIFIFYFTFFFC
jgi:hypothetical protein